MSRHLLPLVLLFPTFAQAAAPALVPVTGYLVDDAGVPISDQVTLRLALYTSGTSAASVWSEDQIVTVDDGQFTVYLGEASALDLALFRDNGSLYLGLSVDGGAEMTPRFEVATAPFAAYAQYCDDAGSVGGIDPGDLALTGDPVDWTDLTDVPASLLDGDQDTTYSAGTGLSLASGQFSLDAPTVEGLARGVAYHELGELRADLDAVYFANVSCLADQVLMSDGVAWGCTDTADLPLDEATIDALVGNNGYAFDSDLATAESAITGLESDVLALDGRVTTAESAITALQTTTLAFSPPVINFDVQSSAQVTVALVNHGASAASTNLGAALVVPTGFTRVADTCGTSLPARGTCTATFALARAGADGARAGTATIGSASLVLSGTYAAFPSCKWLKSNGTSANGTYFVDPDGPGGFAAFQVYCDMTTDGGGWTLAVVIGANSEDHGLTGQVGTLPILPTDSGPKKLDDRVIRLLVQRGPPPSGAGPHAGYRFTCDGTKHFVGSDCDWRAGKGLPTNADRCVWFYTDELLQTVQNSTACNWGSGALGSHCASASPAAHTYCSHCDYADGAAASGVYIPGGIDTQHQRKGCGHDATGYSKAGTVYVR